MAHQHVERSQMDYLGLGVGERDGTITPVTSDRTAAILPFKGAATRALPYRIVHMRSRAPVTTLREYDEDLQSGMTAYRESALDLYGRARRSLISQWKPASNKFDVAIAEIVRLPGISSDP